MKNFSLNRMWAMQLSSVCSYVALCRLMEHLKSLFPFLGEWVKGCDSLKLIFVFIWGVIVLKYYLDEFVLYSNFGFTLF